MAETARGKGGGWKLANRLARKKGLLVDAAAGETLLYYLERAKGHDLNRRVGVEAHRLLTGTLRELLHLDVRIAVVIDSSALLPSALRLPEVSTLPARHSIESHQSRRL